MYRTISCPGHTTGHNNSVVRTCDSAEQFRGQVTGQYRIIMWPEHTTAQYNYVVKIYYYTEYVCGQDI